VINKRDKKFEYKQSHENFNIHDRSLSRSSSNTRDKYESNYKYRYDRNTTQVDHFKHNIRIDGYKNRIYDNTQSQNQYEK